LPSSKKLGALKDHKAYHHSKAPGEGAARAMTREIRTTAANATS
jgi:hypothetical protein